MKKLVIVPALFFALTACEHKSKVVAENKVLEKETMAVSPVMADRKSDVKQKLAAGNNTPIEKKIVKEGDISFETNNISETRRAITNSLNKSGGYIAEENESNNSDNNRKEYTIKARIPANSFDKFVDDVSSGAEKIDSKNISMKDVTTEYIDITTQLANKKKLEESYLALLKQGKKVSDLLDIEEKLTDIQSDIESTQGQLNYLTKQVEYSEFDITFYTKLAVVDDGKTFGYKFLSALSDGWDILGALFFGFIGLWPIWLIVIVLYMIIKAWRKRVRQRRTMKNQNT